MSAAELDACAARLASAVAEGLSEQRALTKIKERERAMLSMKSGGSGALLDDDDDD